MFKDTPSILHLSDLFIGQEITIPENSGSIKITEDMQKYFTNLTGDINPMHTDESFAKDKGFSGIICYGMLTASFYSTLIGVYLPGKYAIFQEADISFSKPVYIGDELKIKGKIIEINDVLKRITIKAEIRNQNNERISKATLIAGLTE